MTIQEIAVDGEGRRRERYKLIQYYCRQQFIVKRDVFLMCTDRRIPTRIRIYKIS